MRSYITRRGFLAGLATVPAAASVVLPTRTCAAGTETSLANAAKQSGRLFGAAVRTDQLEREEDLRNAVLRDCCCITPEIHMKWDALEPRRGTHCFEPMDRLVSFASAHGLGIHGHTLLWDQSTPGWAKRHLSETRDWRLIQDHISEVMSRYRHAVERWDVVNEPIASNEAKNGLRDNVFLRAFGPSYIANALRDARIVAPNAKLFINDYGFEYDNSAETRRRRAFLKLLEQTISRGLPLDGVGLQAHLDLGKGKIKSSILRPFLKEISDLGLEIVVTELDVKEHNISKPVTERDQRVADEARRYLDIVLDYPSVKGVTVWGLSDRHSWLSLREAASREQLNRGLPYDADFDPKPLYWVLQDALAARNAA